MLSRRLAQLRPSRPKVTALELPMQSNPARFNADGETRLKNCYAEQAGKEGKIPFPLYAVDGLMDYATLTNGGQCRGMFATDSLLYVVSARILFAVDSSGSATEIGGVADDGPVFFSRNRANPTEIVITTTGGLKYAVTNSTNLAEIDDTDLPPPNSNAFIDGYTLYGLSDGRVFYSGIDNATAIGANDFFEAEGSPDGLVRVFVHQRTIFLLGKKTTELWDSVGDSNNPFQRSAGGFLEYGCAAPASVASLGNNIVFVDDTGRVTVSNGAGAQQRISTHAVERAIDALTDKTTIEGFVYSRRGHEFYVLSAATFTWIYDLTTGQWHERQSFGQTRWRAAYHAEFNGKHIVGDFEDGVLYQIDPDTYDESGDHLVMTVRVPIHAWPKPVKLNFLRFDMIPGVGLNSTDLHDSDPKLMIRLSQNGGKSWGNERTASIGLIGQYGAETKFSGLGWSNEDGFLVEASVSATVIRAFTGMSGELNVKRR